MPDQPCHDIIVLFSRRSRDAYADQTNARLGAAAHRHVARASAAPARSPVSRSIPKEGPLTAIGHTATEQQPRGFAIDPTGRYLLAVGQLSDSMTSYAIDPASGKLDKLKQYPMGKNPNWVEIVNLP